MWLAVVLRGLTTRSDVCCVVSVSSPSWFRSRLRHAANVHCSMGMVGPWAPVRGVWTVAADQGPQALCGGWRRFLRGHVDVVVGTRAASYAPVHNLGLVAWWDDGDDLHEEPRAPYAHLRDLPAVRARATRSAVLVGGYSPSVQLPDCIAPGRLVDLQSSWGGQASTAFQSVLADWNATQQRVEESLAAINGALGHAGRGYAEVEERNARMFVR